MHLRPCADRVTRVVARLSCNTPKIRPKLDVRHIRFLANCGPPLGTLESELVSRFPHRVRSYHQPEKWNSPYESAWSLRIHRPYGPRPVRGISAHSAASS